MQTFLYSIAKGGTRVESHTPMPETSGFEAPCGQPDILTTSLKLTQVTLQFNIVDVVKVYFTKASTQRDNVSLQLSRVKTVRSTQSGLSGAERPVLFSAAFNQPCSPTEGARRGLMLRKEDGLADEAGPPTACRTPGILPPLQI